MKILNVAEKPSVAKSISALFSTTARSVRGKHKYCSNIFFTYKEEMIFTSVLGHLYSYDFETKTLWNESDPFSLFDSKITRELGKDMRPVAENIQALARECSVIVVWTDCDREGENIAMQIKSLVPGVPVKRARFSAIERNAVQHAMNNLVEINEREADAVDARIELDLRIGSAFTRLQTISQEKNGADKAKVLSFGPCQIPTLNFVVQRHEQIKNFVPESFYSLSNTIKSKEDGVATCFKWIRGNVFDKNCVLIFYEMLRKGNAVISDERIEPTEKYRPLPLRTVEFQRVCSSYYKMSGHRLMEIAEKLYNGGYISYPRTETDAFPKNFNFESVIKKMRRDQNLGEYAESFVFRAPRAGKNNDQAHSPIYPLKEGTGLEGDSRKVYEFVARRFLACVSENAKGVKTDYTMRIEYSEENRSQQRGRGFEEFKCSGLRITERNYLDIYIYEKWEDSQIGKFSINERVDNHVEMTQGETTPPQYLSESDLISLMDKHGIGTDATIHEHIQKIQTRGYARLEKHKFIPNQLGINLIKIYKVLELGVNEPVFRRNLEEGLKAICNGEKKKSQLVSDEIALYKKIYKKLYDGIDLFKRILQENDGDGPGDGPMSRKPGKENRSNARPSNEAGGPKSRKTGKENRTNTKPPKAEATRRSSEAVMRLIVGQGIPQEEAVRCECGNEAKGFVAKKGEKSGKKFYRCAETPRRCEFFQWEGEEPPSKRSKGQAAFREDLKCECGFDPVKKTAHTEANNGRDFYCCNKNYKRCKFFMWAD